MSVWIDDLARRYQSAIDLMESALRDCPDDLWEASMWKVFRRGPYRPIPGPDGVVDEDPEVQERLLQSGSAVWAIAYHALWFVDFDLSGGLEPWEPPLPFGKRDQGAGAVTRTWTKDELLDYVEWCRQRAKKTLGSLTDDRVATPLPKEHRNSGRTYAWLLLGIPHHLIEHASQIRQFITTASPPDALARIEARNQARQLRTAVVGRSDEQIAAMARGFGGFQGLLGIVFGALSTRIKPETDPLQVAFVHGDDVGFEFRVVDGKGEVSEGIGGDASAIFRSTPSDLLRLVVGELTLDDAIGSGRVVIEGDYSDVRRLFSNFR